MLFGCFPTDIFGGAIALPAPPAPPPLQCGNHETGIVLVHEFLVRYKRYIMMWIEYIVIRDSYMLVILYIKVFGVLG